jgi:hypothetical protein
LNSRTLAWVWKPSLIPNFSAKNICIGSQFQTNGLHCIKISGPHRIT